jgi:hypothetical protein
MRTIKLYTLTATAGLLLAGMAQADESTLFGQGGYAAQSTHTSVATVRGPVHNAEPHWTSRIGTGTATALEAGNSSSTPVQQGAPHYPAPYWASLIGTGTAAKL